MLELGMKRAKSGAGQQASRAAARRQPAGIPRGAQFSSRPTKRTPQPAQQRTSSRRERSAERREAILAAALDEFSQAGFAATRLDDVARRAGVAKGTIYLHFRDKEALFQEILRSMLAPIVGRIEALGSVEHSTVTLGERIVELFMREIYETRRKDVIRLILTEGRRFPHLAEFYYREVLSHVLTAMRALLARAVARGEAAPGLVDFPQLVAAPALIAVVWGGLFERFEPLDVRTMLRTHVDLLFGPGRTK
jgi:AcrR family transcriptional regulator